MQIAAAKGMTHVFFHCVWNTLAKLRLITYLPSEILNKVREPKLTHILFINVRGRIRSNITTNEAPAVVIAYKPFREKCIFTYCALFPPKKKSI